MSAITILGYAALGGIWRWLDGRGYGPNGVRVGACAILAMLALAPIGLWALPLGAVFAALWTLRQKQREVWLDMALRWAAPFAVFGVMLALAAGNVMAVPIMAVAGALIATLVWAGTHVRMGRLDPAAVTEAASGAVAFGALVLAGS